MYSNIISNGYAVNNTTKYLEWGFNAIPISNTFISDDISFRLVKI